MADRSDAPQEKTPRTMPIDLGNAWSGGDPIAVSRDIQEDAARVGFDWPDAAGVLDKIREETEEIRTAWLAGDQKQAQKELGDLLLATVNLSRFLAADPYEELNRATQRFSKRFAAVKIEVARQGKQIEQCSLEELDKIWNQVKRCAE